MKRIFILIILISSSISASNASPITVVSVAPDSSMDAGYLDGVGFMEQFTGTLEFQKTCFGLPLNLSCDLSFDAWFSDSSGTHLDISISNLLAVGTGFCGMATTGTSVASIAHGDLPTLSPPPAKQLYESADFTIPNFLLETVCGSCSGNMSGSYTNTNGGTIGLNAHLTSGNCFMTGQATPTTNNYLLWH